MDEQQRALADASRDGLAVFAASESHVELLRGCRMTGRYRYLGLSPKQQSVLLKDDAQVRVNVALDPATGTPPSPLTLDFIQVGRWATTRRSARGATFGGSCEGATHFARTLSVGEASRGANGVVPSSCESSSSHDQTPPSRCRRFLRVDLVALEDAVFDTSNGDVTFCPAGWALADDICVPRGSESVFECRDDAGECRRQCDRGSAASCTRLGYLLAHGEAGFVRDDRQALSFYERACTAGYPPACFNVGVLHWVDGPIPRDEVVAEQSWARACLDGYAAACSNLGLLHIQRRSGPVDRKRAGSYFARACAGGEPHGCLNAAHVMGGEELARSGQDLGSLLSDACDGDVATGCLELSIWLDRHGAMPASTKALVDKACRLGSREACERLAPQGGI